MKIVKRTLVIFLAVFIGGIFIQATQVGVAIPNEAFNSGEVLKYSLHYGWLNGGVAFLDIQEKELDGEKVYHARAVAKTIGIADKLYRVRDIYESYINPETGLPIKSIRNVRESNYKKYNEVLYNHEDSTIVSKLSGKRKVPANIQDMLSAFYYARRILFKNINEGEVVTIETYFDDELYPLHVRYLGKETIRSKVGKIKCLKFSPVVEPGRVFDTEDDLKIWVSDDKNFIPVRVQLNFIVGSVKCDLEAYSGLKNKLNLQ